MQYLGGKLSAAQLQVAGWVGSVRRSLQGALDLVWGSSEDRQDEEPEEGADGGGRFQRAVSPLRNFARRSGRSLRRLAARSRTSARRKAGDARSVRTLVALFHACEICFAVLECEFGRSSRSAHDITTNFLPGVTFTRSCVYR